MSVNQTSNGGAECVMKSNTMRMTRTVWTEAVKLRTALTLLIAVLALSVGARGQVVISQVYGGGNNSGANWLNDYVELYNRGPNAQSLNGWSVQYASGGSTTAAFSGVAPLPNVTLQPGQYFLVQLTTNSTGTGAALPTPDHSPTGTPTFSAINMSNQNGKVALVSSTTPLSTSQPTGVTAASIVDFVGFGNSTTNWNLSSVLTGVHNALNNAPNPDTTANVTCIFRQGHGAIDYRTNAVDFSVGAARPRNSSFTIPTRTPYNTRINGLTAAANSNAALGDGEYGTLNSNRYFGAGNGFSGQLGAGTVYFTNDASNLYFAFQPGAALNDSVVVYLDTRAGGFNDASLSDTSDTARTVVSNPGAGGLINFPQGFGADFAIYIDLNGVTVYDLNNGSSFNFISFNNSVTGANTVLREISVPFSSLGGFVGGQHFDFFALLTSTSTRFFSNESLPPSSALNTAASVGTSGGTSLMHFNRYVSSGTLGSVVADCNTTPIPVATTGTNAIEGTISAGEYTSNIAGGTNTGFGGILAAASNLNMISDGARLKIGFKPSGAGFTDANNFSVLYLDTRNGGFSSTGAIFGDTSTNQLRAATRPGAGGVTFPANFLADFAVVYSSGGIWVYELSGTASPTQVASSASAPNGGTFFNAGANANARELEVPFNLIGNPSAGTPIGYFMLLCNGTNGFLSDESIPANILPGGNPGNSAATVTNFGRFRLAGNNISPSLAPSTPVATGTCVGSTLTIQSGLQPHNGNVGVEWLINGTAQAGQQTVTFAKANAQTADTSSLYAVRLTRPCTTVTSTTFSVTVTAPAVITQQPQDVSVCGAGTTTTITVAATGTTLSYQWQRSTDGGTVWVNATGNTGATSSTLTTLSSDTSGIKYRCIVTTGGFCSTTISSASTVTVNSLPLSPTGTFSYTGTAGSPTTMSVNVLAGETAEWFTGACSTTLVNTGTSYTVTPTLGGTYTYFVRAKNTTTGCTSTGCVTVTLNVPVPNDLCSGAVTLALNTPVDGTLSGAAANFQIPSGATSYLGLGQTTTSTGDTGRDAVYTFTPATSGRYSVRVSNGRSSSNLILYMTTACPSSSFVVFTQGQVVAASNRSSATGSSGTDVAASEELFNLQLTAGTQYWIIVDETTLSTPSSTFTIEVNPCAAEVEPNSTPATATPYVFGSSGMEFSFNATSDIDFFSLGTPASGSRIFAMTDGMATSTADTQIRVTTGTDTLEFDEDDGDFNFGPSGFNSVIAGTPANGAATYLRLTHFSSSTVNEPYRLYAVVQPPSASATVESEPNESTATATSSSGNYFSGSVASTSDNDIFSFTATAGQLIFAALDCAPSRTTAAFDGSLALLNASGATLVSVNGTTSTSNTTTSGAGSLTSSTPTSAGEGLVWRARYTGTYYVRVSGNSSTNLPGSYLLSIAANNPAPVSGACCVGLTCSSTTDLACTAQFGVFQGASSTCSPNPCLPTGACCNNLGVCSTVVQSVCLATSGSVYLGDGVTCSPTPCLTVTATALNSNSVNQGCETLITVTVAPGSNPASSGVSVTANLSAIGGSSTQPLYDDASNGDATAGDNIFSFRAGVAGSTTTGTKTLSYAVSDTQGRTTSGNFSTLTVNNYYSITQPLPAPTGIAGATVTLTATVAAASPTGSGNSCTTATGAAVLIDLSTLGGGSAVPMTEGPAGTWTVSYALPIAQAESTYTLPVSLSDSQGRTRTGSLSLTVGYCAATSNACTQSNNDERISQVVFNTITNPSTPNTGAGPSGCYTNNTSISTTVQRTQTYPITVLNAGPFSGDLCSVYIDWNQNGVLNDTGETTVLTGSGTSNAATFTGNISVPAGAALGNTRMRVRLTYTSGQAACGNSSFGETEDYTLNVTTPPAFTMTATPAPNPASVPQGCSTVISATLAGTYAAPVSVTANLTSIGGSASVPMVETPPNSGIFVLTAPVTLATTPGSKNIAIGAIDSSSATASTTASITVTSGAITVTPASAVTTTSGSTICLQATLATPACNPIAPGTTVTVNLSSIGGPSNFALTDDGSSAGCDATANDLIYGSNFTIGGSTVGVFTLPVTVTEPGGRTATANLSVTVRPANDECAGAITLPDGATNGLSIAGASTSAPTWGCVSSSAQNDVWFKYTTCASGTLTIDTCGSRNSDSGNGIDTVLQVFSGTCGSLTSVGCNDDHAATITGCATTATADSRVSFTATAGTTYYFRVARYSTTGTDKFNVRIFGPAVGDPTSPSASPSTVCLGTPSTLSATVGAGGDEVQWFTGSCGGSLVGTGATLIVNPGATTTYFARSRNIASSCVSGCVSTTVTVVPSPTADAGSAQTICASDTATLNGSATNAASTTWSTSGDGAFIDPSSLNTVYTPGSADLANGTVTLTLTASANTPCSDATSQVVITIQPLPLVNAGSAESICSGSQVNLNGSASFVTSFSWGTSGDGSFANPASLTTTYTPGTADIANGTVTLTLNGLAIAPCAGSVSSNKIVTINPPTAIGTPPSSQSVCENSSASFSVSATGLNLSYQWRKNGMPVGTDSATYSIASVTAADAGSYDCVVTGTCGTATSAAATLTVKPLTAIATQPPSSASQCNGSTTTFGVSATGSLLMYLWQQSTDNGMNWAPAAGANSFASYTTSGTAVNNTLFQCVVTGECGPPITSGVVTLTVNDVPSIDTQPSSTITACVGQTPSISVAASGYAPLSYAWEYSVNGGMTWNPAPGTNDLASYTLQSVAAGDAGNQYRVLVSNPCGTTTSSISTLSLSGSVTLTATIELQGVSTGTMQRCITFTVFDGNCPGGTSYSTDVTFVNGVGSATLNSLGCSSVTGVAIRDRKHTLRRVALAGSPALDVSNPNAIVATFTSTASSSLIGGNVNDDAFVDILDFGGYIGQLGGSIGSSTGCSLATLHPDFSGDGLVGTSDFTFISSNFLSQRDSDPCGSPILAGPNQPGGPQTDVSVISLITADLWDSARGDINRDGRLSVADAVFAAEHGLPACVADFNAMGGVSVQDIFDFMASWITGHPATDVNRDRVVSVQDLFDFLTAFFSGC